MFKLINAAAHDCPITLELESHIFKIIRTEGSDLLPVFVKKMTIYPGRTINIYFLSVIKFKIRREVRL